LTDQTRQFDLKAPILDFKSIFGHLLSLVVFGCMDLSEEKSEPTSGGAAKAKVMNTELNQNRKSDSAD
jgi:hypothetical protein